MTETTGSVTLNYGYNANGSLTTKHEGSVLQSEQVWDVRGRLAGMKDGSGNWLSQYRYTPEGTRSAVTEGGTTTLHVIDVLGPSGYAQVIEERTAAGVVVGSYVYGPALDPLSQWRDGQGANLYLADGHSGVRQAVSLAGAVLLAQRFDAFGVTVATVGTLANVIGYRGERFDSTLGQYYLRARFYNPMSGRFTAMDPYAGNYGDPLQAMRYGYAGANPVGAMDPSGLIMAASLGGFAGRLGGGFHLPSVLGTGRQALVVGGTLFGGYGGLIVGFADGLIASNGDINYAIKSAFLSAITGAVLGAMFGLSFSYSPAATLFAFSIINGAGTTYGVNQAIESDNTVLAVYRAVVGIFAGFLTAAGAGVSSMPAAAGIRPAAISVFVRGSGIATNPAPKQAGRPLMYGGGYDPRNNTAYLGVEMGHPNGMNAAGGSATTAHARGLTVIDGADGVVYWGDISQSLPKRLDNDSAVQVHLGLLQFFAGRAVKYIASLQELPPTARGE